MKIRADSTEYAKATVTVDHDITGKTIEVALPVADTPPVETDYVTADTVGSVVDNGNDTWTATYRILIGPAAGQLELTAGTTYDWTRRITDTPEVPVAKTGQVQCVAVG